ncbi:MAG: phage portal protein [Planctomycetes bacterium]|nr:phage portal protein [Planctomycetota bacterium]
MGFDLGYFGDAGLEEDYLEWLVDERAVDVQNHFGKLWDYYVNQMYDGGSGGEGDTCGRCYRQGQEYGLASRITGYASKAGGGIFSSSKVKNIQRKEVVIENDIAWRISAAVDFLFGKPINFISKSPSSRKRLEIETIIKAVFSTNGGIGFFQDMAVLGGVYGFVDCFVRPGKEILEHNSFSSRTHTLTDVLQLARTIDLELIEAPRALPVLDEDDYKKVRYYVQHFHQRRNSVSNNNGFFSKLIKGRGYDRRKVVTVTEITSADGWQRYEEKELVAEGKLGWGFLPVVHIQNIAQPYYYEGVSDVEVLIPLQDELNTRLSDRANRITFQAFKMYLGKGIEGFEDRPIAPGRMWYTDNPDATIEEFGGDRSAPTEDIHICEIRDAMDKASGVTPVVAGILKNRVGNLTSAVAIKMTLMGMLSKTERKKFTYGEGLKKIVSMVLKVLDKANIYKTDEADRDVDLFFPSPLPEDTMEQLEQAKIKKELGVPTEQVLKELGYENLTL